MEELVGQCTKCDKKIYCENGFLNGMYENGKLYCERCYENLKEKDK
ncbi:hypothetical protein GCM10007216_07220 [Thalassobacillus devorans]|uniref:LIM zinc-binding domain-containing protein n=1 Tax=Thalassobacillus devorans TaxID=279813 RepID=A0ABQ1NSV6_9BACI|nr:hypothetical protein [Thalassobacillus devorans]GGC79291.1 hypothetical protein GCM10007216_07220 [Thalassobacillus devorans]